MDAICKELSCAALGLATGAILMAAYDALRLLRFFIRHSALWTGIEDLLYWIASAWICFLFLRGANGGETRAYMIASVLAGMLLYDRTASRILSGLLKKVRKYFKMKR